MLYAIVGVIAVIIDQAVKYWVAGNVWNETIPLIPGILSIVNVHNDGAAFSFLAGGGARIPFIVLTVVFAVVVIIALATNFISGKLGRWCMVMVTAGGMANCIDRVIYGYVQDMFKVELFNFAVFNVADIFITVFCIIFILYILFGGEKEPVKADEFSDDDEDEEYEEKPVKRSRRKKAVIEDDGEESEPVSPVKKAAKKARTAPAEEDFEEEVRPVRVKAAKPAPAANDDPFAEWEKANAKVKAQQETKVSSRSMQANTRPVYTPEKAPKVSAQNPRPVVNPLRTAPQTEAQAAAREASIKYQNAVSAAAQASAATTAVKPAETKSAPVSDTEFSLDDILNEFK